MVQEPVTAAAVVDEDHDAQGNAAKGVHAHDAACGLGLERTRLLGTGNAHNAREHIYAEQGKSILQKGTTRKTPSVVNIIADCAK